MNKKSILKNSWQCISWIGNDSAISKNNQLFKTKKYFVITRKKRR